MSRAKVENKIHSFMGPLCKGVYSDAFWTPISNVAKHFKSEGIDLDLISAQYKGTGSDKRKEWHYEVREPSIEKGGWHLTVTASFGPSTLDEKGENQADRYDLNYVLSWDGRMKHSASQSVPSTLEAKAASKNKLTESIGAMKNEILDQIKKLEIPSAGEKFMRKDIEKALKVYAASEDGLASELEGWLKNSKFMSSIPQMIEAAGLAKAMGLTQKNKEMVEFNSQAIDFLSAMGKKDLDAAVAAANKLIKAGHGAAFGLDEMSHSHASLHKGKKEEIKKILVKAGLKIENETLKLKDLIDFVTAEHIDDWSDEKLNMASQAIAKKCMSLHKGDSAWNPICAETLATDLEHSLGFVNAVKLTQVIESAWKDKKRDLESLSAEIKAALSKMKNKL